MTVYDLVWPILLSGLATHFLSTLFWTAMPHHKPEWQGMPAEDEFMDWTKKHSLNSGQYVFPFCADGKEAASAEFKQKQGTCNGMLIFWPTPTHMGKAIALTLTFFIIAAFVIGYLASLALQPGASFMKVFQFVTTAGLLAHCSAKFPFVFWFRRKIGMEIIDGVAYAVATGLIFSAMWPSA